MTEAAADAEPRLGLVGAAWRRAPLRRLCLSTAAFRVAEMAVWVALIAYAYTAGGVGRASAVVVAQLLPATAFALFVGDLIRRRGAAAILRWGFAAQAVGLLAAAALLRGGSSAGAFFTIMIAVSAFTTTRPALSVLAPSMVDGPDELTAVNVFSGALFSIAGLAGPAAAAVLMTAIGSWAVFAAMSVLMAAAAGAVWRLPAAHVVGDEDPQSLVAGLRVTARAPGPRVIVLAIAAYYVVIGALEVLSVVIAVELYDKTAAFSGWVTTAIGVGSLIAGAVALLMIGRRWISAWILVSALGIGVSLVAVSVSGSRVAVSMTALAVFGIAESIYEIAALMLLQRVSRLDLLGHIFALVESLQMAMIAVGAATVPLAVHVFGSAGAPAALGVLFTLVAAVLGTRFVVIDRHARVPIIEMAALRATPLFRALPGPALETVAREARWVEAPSGTVVVRQGDPGTDFFAVVSGALAVSVDGEQRATLARGDAFGEVALIRDVARLATVQAIADTVLLAVGREPFLTAVTGHTPTHTRASTISAGHADHD